MNHITITIEVVNDEEGEDHIDATITKHIDLENQEAKDMLEHIVLTVEAWGEA